MKNNSGQVLPYYLMALMVLLVCWAMLLNMGKLLRDRIMMQNAADNAALSVAVYRARALNLIGAANYNMGYVLSLGAAPRLIPIPTYSSDFVGGSVMEFPFCDVKCRGGFENNVEYGGVTRLRFTVNRLAEFQKGVVLAYTANAMNIANTIGSRQEIDASGRPAGADRVFVIPASLAGSLLGKINEGHPFPSEGLASLSPERLLGLKRNSRRITYYKTRNVGATVDTHYHVVLPEKWMSENTSWYVTAKNFSQQKLIAFAIKDGSSRSNRGYPVFRSLLGIEKWPAIYTMAAAATYNTKGAMFPESEGACTGVSPWVAASASAITAYQLRQLSEMEAKLQSIPVIGNLTAAAMEIYKDIQVIDMTAKLIEALNDKDTPVNKYDEAEYGGWDAHLVPVGDGVIRH